MFSKEAETEIATNKQTEGRFDWIFYHRPSTVVPKDKQPDNFHCEKKGIETKFG